MARLTRSFDFLSALETLMRIPIFCIVTASVVACGGAAPTGPAGPGAPASVAIAAGDGQIAEPGISVSINPAALVRDAAGHPVPGTTVTFRVDSGGGTLSSSTAITGANGVAAAGEWRLGLGANVLSASVGALPLVRFHATGRFGPTRTIINGQAVGASGGTLRYSQPGDALNGLEIRVPSGAYPGTTAWTVTADSTVQVPLPADFSQVGPVLVIGNGQGYAASLIALTVPIRVGTTDAVAPFFFDPTSGTLEGVPLLARTDSSITFASRHFSGSLMAIPGSAPGPSGVARSANVLGAFGTIKMVFIKIPQSKLLGTFTSTFRPGQDDWEFTNNGDYQSPHGSCEGMAATALYYHYFFRAAGAPPLYGRFDKFLSNDWDNVRGVHLTGAVQADYVGLYETIKAQQEVIRAATQRNNETPESLAATWILFNLKLNSRPLLVGVHGPPGSHAIVAYQATATAGIVEVGIADPNQPGVGRTLTFQGGNMVPLQFQTIATGPADYFTNATVFGETSATPLANFHSRWAEFVAGTPGEDRLPNPRAFEVFDSVNTSWSTLPDTVRLLADTLKLRMRCPACPVKFTHAVAGPDLIQLVVTDPQATSQLGQGIFPAIGGSEGVRQYFVRASALAAGAGNAFLDGRLFTVIRGKLRLFPQFLDGRKDSTYRFTLTHGGTAKADTRFVWNFGDGTPVQTVTGDSLRSHTYAAVGDYTVTIEMRDAGNKLLGRTTSLVTIGETTAGFNAWKFTAMTMTFTSVAPQLNGYDSRWSADSQILGRIANGTTQGGIRFVGEAFTPTGPSRIVPVGLYLLEGTSVTMATVSHGLTENIFSIATFPNAPLAIPAAPMVSGWNLVEQAAPTNPLCNIAEDAFALSGTVSQGHLTGRRVRLCVQSSDLPSINGRPLMSMDVDVSFTPTAASGVITVTYYWYGNGSPVNFFQRVARLSFSAVRLVP